MRFSDDFLNDLRSKIDIEDLIARYAEVRGRGRTPVCLCPFHNEKTPSFVIYKDTQSYYCFGCGAGGDAITFIRTIENLDYTDAVRFLCERTGTDFPNDPVDDELTRRRRRCYEANREAARFFHAQLSQPHAQQARDYLQKRALTRETVVRFGLGYAPDSWDALLKHMRSKGFTDNELILYDLARKGITVERNARTVVIHNIEILRVELPEDEMKLLAAFAVKIDGNAYMSNGAVRYVDYNNPVF